MQGFGPRRVQLLTAQTVDETTSAYVKAQGFGLDTFIIQGDGVTSSGVITLEESDWDEANDPPYGGTASILTTVNASDVNTGSATGSAQKFVHVSATAGAYLRARISTAIGGGGTISVALRQQGS